MTDLTDAMADLDEQKVLNIVNEQIRTNKPVQILDELRRGLDIVGNRFSKNEYFLVELVMSADIFKKAMAIVEPKLLATQRASAKGKVVIGTVQGDIHYIGKNLVVAFLKSNGFEVYDLGEDVPPEKFVDTLKKTGSSILALSGLITTTHDVMRTTIEALKTAGIRKKVKVMIGGGDIGEEIVKYTGADAFGRDALSAVELAKKFTAGTK
ncbi:MAG: cobalamin-binding protein [Candidatus Thorarchaeota archaeon]|nr:MAG: cobalamin-binding protein [Candidatus Thorarchaeota archaeon]